MKKNFFLLFLITLNTFCQKSIPIYGTVLDSISSVYNANIINKNSKIGTSTNTDGEFKIFCEVGDTLVISSIQHEEKKLVINKTNFKNLTFQIFLDIKTYNLDEFELKKNNFLGFLKSDISLVKKNNNDINAVTLGLPNAGRKKLNQVDRKIYTATSGNGPISLDLIINSISGRLQKLKKEKKIFEEDEAVNKLFEEFKFNLATNFRINKEDEYRFLYFCISDSLYENQFSKNKLEFIKFLQSKAIEFNKLKKE